MSVISFVLLITSQMNSFKSSSITTEWWTPLRFIIRQTIPSTWNINTLAFYWGFHCVFSLGAVPTSWWGDRWGISLAPPSEVSAVGSDHFHTWPSESVPPVCPAGAWSGRDSGLSARTWERTCGGRMMRFSSSSGQYHCKPFQISCYIMLEWCVGWFRFWRR